MTFVGKLANTLSESFLSRILNSTLELLKPIKYAIDNIFQFMFGAVKAKNTHRLLFCLGFGVLAYKLFRFIYKVSPVVTGIAKHFYYKSSFNKLKFKEKYGANCWALVTGFTEGIGFGFAQELARMKYNLILVGRNPTKIQYVQRWLKQINPDIQIRVIELDFNTQPEKLYQQVYQKTLNYDVGIVVNNVGMAAGGYFADIQRHKLTDVYTVNVNSQVELCKIFLPRFKARANRSALINLSSCTGVFPSPRVGLYTFSKTYNDVFSRILQKQFSQYGVDVLTVRPFGVTTPMMGMKKGPLMATPRDCVQRCIFELGRENETFGSWKHKLSGLVFGSMTQQQRLQKYDSGFKVVQDGIRGNK